MSWFSQAKNFVFNSLFASAARASTTVANPTQQSAGAAALAVVAPTVKAVADDVSAGIDQHKSSIGILNTVVGDLESGLKTAVETFALSTVGSLPVVGGLLAPEAKNLADMAFDFAEQHVHDYVAALFAHHKASVADNVSSSQGVLGQSASGQSASGPSS